MHGLPGYDCNDKWLGLRKLSNKHESFAHRAYRLWMKWRWHAVCCLPTQYESWQGVVKQIGLNTVLIPTKPLGMIQKCSQEKLGRDIIQKIVVLVVLIEFRVINKTSCLTAFLVDRTKLNRTSDLWSTTPFAPATAAGVSNSCAVRPAQHDTGTPLSTVNTCMTRPCALSATTWSWKNPYQSITPPSPLLTHPPPPPLES